MPSNGRLLTQGAWHVSRARRSSTDAAGWGFPWGERWTSRLADPRPELATLQVAINEEKSRIVDLAQGEQCSFLGFDFRRVRSRRGVWRAWYPPRLKKRTALRRKLKEICRRYQSQPIERVMALMNPILRGWVRYFAVGDASRCLSYIKDWVEKKVRRHLMRARKRRGFGWKRRSRQWLYQRLGLFNNYRVHRPRLKALPTG
jgi:RNA-directed DNA polymerase